MTCFVFRWHLSSKKSQRYANGNPPPSYPQAAPAQSSDNPLLERQRAPVSRHRSDLKAYIYGLKRADANSDSSLPM